MEFIYNGHSNDAGIYRLTNKLNGRTYYGSAKNFKVRWHAHESSLKVGKAVNKFLQADFNKCGTDAFVFEVLEVTTGIKEERLAIEQTYLDLYHDAGKQCYNFMKVARSPEGRVMKDESERRRKISTAMKGKKRTAEHQAKLNLTSASTKGRAKSPEQIKKQSDAMRGRKLTEEHKKAIAEGNKGREVSEETRRKLSEYNAGLKPSEACYEALRLYNLTHEVSEETRAKLSIALKGNTRKLGKKASEETKAKMRASHAARRLKVLFTLA